MLKHPVRIDLSHLVEQLNKDRILIETCFTFKLVQDHLEVMILLIDESLPIDVQLFELLVDLAAVLTQVLKVFVVLK